MHTVTIYETKVVEGREVSRLKYTIRPRDRHYSAQTFATRGAALNYADEMAAKVDRNGAPVHVVAILER